ncbi:MAG: hypothetical protein HYX48_02770 [Chlamydiales bacterium]|nr:hypothetical protein [Chlamydiales bacterium]
MIATSPRFDASSQIANQALLELLPCVGCCESCFEWIDCILMATATVLAVIGVALAFFSGAPELGMICGLIGIVTAYKTVVECLDSDDKEIEVGAEVLEHATGDLASGAKTLTKAQAIFSKQLADSQKIIDGLEKSKNSLEASLSSVRAELQAKSSSEGSLKTQNDTLVKSESALRTQLEEFQKGMEALNKLCSGYSDQTRELMSEIGLLGKEKESLGQATTKLSGERASFTALVDKGQQALAEKILLGQQAAQKILALLKDERASAEAATQKLAAAGKELDKDSAELEGRVAQLKAVEAEITTKTEQLQKLSADLQELRSSFDQAVKSVQEQQAALHALSAETATAQANLNATTQLLDTKNQELVAAQRALTAELESVAAKKEQLSATYDAKIKEKTQALSDLLAKIKAATPTSQS